EDIPAIGNIYATDPELTYDGSYQSSDVDVYDIYGDWISSENYTVNMQSGKNIGTYTGVVVFKGDYTGVKAISFNINPKGATIKNPSKAKKSFTAKWKQQKAKMPKSRVTGYQVRYSTEPAMAYAKYKNVKKYSKTSLKVKKLQAKTTYYVQVRTYMNVGGRTYYSAWSGVKSVKTK
ncbi:MAG: fibronectin type III domain-containing protein, partial [Mogibacterium sp.]|nr:fibronectin type III domain-containing protein [Mogibacterium sp.]